MKYRTNKRTKNLTLRDIQINDWVQEWNPYTNGYLEPRRVIGISHTGYVRLASHRCGFNGSVTKIEHIDALPIDGVILKGFGFEVSDFDTDRGEEYQNVNYKGMYIGQVRYPSPERSYLRLCGYSANYMHEFAAYLFRNRINIELEWQGFD